MRKTVAVINENFKIILILIETNVSQVKISNNYHRYESRGVQFVLFLLVPPPGHVIIFYTYK